MDGRFLRAVPDRAPLPLSAARRALDRSMLRELGFKALEKHQSVPVPVMRVLLGRVLEGTHVAVCLHRVDDGTRGAPTAMETVIHPNELDQLLGILIASRPSAATPWLMVCFDDGYADAAEYV